MENSREYLYQLEKGFAELSTKLEESLITKQKAEKMMQEAV